MRGPRWQQTAWGRILIGLILAQGLFYGLRHLVTGILLASSETSPQEVWSDVRNLLLLQALFAPELRKDAGTRRDLLTHLYEQTGALAASLPGHAADPWLIASANALYLAGRGSGTTYKLPPGGSFEEQLRYVGYPDEMIDVMIDCVRSVTEESP